MSLLVVIFFEKLVERIDPFWFYFVAPAELERQRQPARSSAFDSRHDRVANNTTLFFCLTGSVYTTNLQPTFSDIINLRSALQPKQ